MYFEPKDLDYIWRKGIEGADVITVYYFVNLATKMPKPEVRPGLSCFLFH